MLWKYWLSLIILFILVVVVVVLVCRDKGELVSDRQCVNVYNNVHYMSMEGQWQDVYRRKLGAENNTNKVASNVNNVKMIRHKRSTTIAANFQSINFERRKKQFDDAKKKTKNKKNRTRFVFCLLNE